MFRIYLHNDDLLFAENANLDKGTHLGLLIEENPGVWSFWANKQIGIRGAHLTEIAAKIDSLENP